MLLSSSDSQRTRTGLFLRGLLPQAHELPAGAGLIQAAHLWQEQQSAGPGPSAGPAGSPGRPPALHLRHVQGVRQDRRWQTAVEAALGLFAFCIFLKVP